MAKRNIRKTDPEIVDTPERRHSSASEPNGRAAAPKTTRSRRKSDVAVAASAAPGAPEGAAVELSHDQIAERAYHLYLERGRQPGDPFADWLTAERELRERFVGV